MDNVNNLSSELHNLEVENINNAGVYSELALIASLQKKKNKIRQELNKRGILPKGAVNEYDNYEYFSEAQYKELFTELFSSYGIELYITEVSYSSFEGTDKQPFGRIVTLGCKLIDIDTGYSEISNHTGEGLDRADKAGYKATTGALKRFLSSTFLVATKDDPEREEEKTVTKKTKAQNIKKNVTKGTITEGQQKQIKALFKNNIEELKKIMISYGKKKIEELNLKEASEIISKKKEEK